MPVGKITVKGGLVSWYSVGGSAGEPSVESWTVTAPKPKKRLSEDESSGDSG
jgi:hypothetical protein